MKKLFWTAVAVIIMFGSPVFVQAGSFIDDSGNKITFDKPFTRVISLYAAHTENIISMGAEKQLIGVSPHETYPPVALTKPVFSYHDDVEKFLQAQPDLVLIRPMIYRGYKKLVDRLKEAGIEVVSLQPTTVDGMFDYWLKLGKLLGKEQDALEMIATFKKKVEEIRGIVEKIPEKEHKKVYFESIHKRMKTFAPNSIAIFVLTTAGGLNVANDARPVRHSNIAEYGKERIISHASEIDVYLAQKGPMNRISVEKIENEPGFQAIKAVAEGKIFIIDESIVSRPTMRILEGIRKIAHILYPDYFGTGTREGSDVVR